jgi:hypothetical protein
MPVRVSAIVAAVRFVLRFADRLDSMRFSSCWYVTCKQTFCFSAV